MAKDIMLFNKDELTYNQKFYRLMDLLITKQAESLGESILFLTIFYLQILSSFFSEQIGILFVFKFLSYADKKRIHARTDYYSCEENISKKWIL